MYTKIKQWFINLFTKPKQTPVADRVAPIVDIPKEQGIYILSTKDVVVEGNKFYTSNSVATDVPITAKRPPAPKAPPPKKGVITSRDHLFDYGCSSRSTSSSSSYDSGCSSSSSSSDSSSSSSGCD